MSRWGEIGAPAGRVLASVEVKLQTKRRLDQEKNGLNPLVLKREVARNLKPITSLRQAHPSNVNNSPPHTPPWGTGQPTAGGRELGARRSPPCSF